VPVPFPDQRLVRPRHELDRLGLLAVAGDRAELVGVRADHVSQRVRVAGVALGARGAVPLPVAGDLPRVDRVNHVPGRQQGLHPRAPVGLDSDRHLLRRGVLGQVRADQLVQPRDPGHAFRQPGPPKPPARLILQFHVVVVG
jgi:hypothetical protein